MTPSDHLLRPSTLCIHAGTNLDERTGGACSPVFPSTAFAYFDTPNQRVLEAKLAALQQGEAAVVFGSDMAAITTLLFAHLKPGDHAIFQPDLYGGTSSFVQELTRFGVAVSFARTGQEFAWHAQTTPRAPYP